MPAIPYLVPEFVSVAAKIPYLIPEFIFLSFSWVLRIAGFSVFSVVSAFSGFQGSRSGIPVLLFFRFFRLFRLSGSNPEFWSFRFCDFFWSTF